MSDRSGLKCAPMFPPPSRMASGLHGNLDRISAYHIKPAAKTGTSDLSPVRTNRDAEQQPCLTQGTPSTYTYANEWDCLITPVPCLLQSTGELDPSLSVGLRVLLNWREIGGNPPIDQAIHWVCVGVVFLPWCMAVSSSPFLSLLLRKLDTEANHGTDWEHECRRPDKQYL